MSAERAFLASLRTAAMAHADVRALLGDPARVYDEAPADAVFPYVTLGRAESRPSGDALEHAITLHVWSRYGGRAEALDVLSALRAALHNAPLEIEDRRCVLVFVQFTDVFRSGDGRTTHGVLRLRAITEPA